MPTIAEIREQYPQYKDLSDVELTNALHRKFYSDMPRAQFNKAIGYTPVETRPDLPFGVSFGPPGARPSVADQNERARTAIARNREYFSALAPTAVVNDVHALEKARADLKAEARKRANARIGDRPNEVAERVPNDSALGAASRSTERSVLPALAGFTGSVAGAEAMAPTAPFTLGLGPLVGGLAGGIGAGYLTNRAQESVLDALPNDYRVRIGQDEAQRQADAEHPLAVFAGGVLPGFAFGRPTRSLPANIGGAGLGGLTELVREGATGQNTLDPALIGEGALAGALQARGYTSARSPGRIIAGRADTPLERLLREKQPEPGDAREHFAAVRDLGEAPVPLDALGRAHAANIGNEATSGSLQARELLQKYATDRTTELPALGRRRADQIAPQDTRTREEATQQASQEALDAQERLRPGTTAGDASTAVSERLLGERTAEKAHADQLYAEAREKGVATLQRRSEETRPQIKNVTSDDGTSYPIRGEALPAKGLAPANLMQDGNVYVGAPRTLHFQIAENFPASEGNDVVDTGFVTPDGRYLDRAGAAKWAKANEKEVRTSDNMRGGLDALDYREQVPESAKRGLTNDSTDEAWAKMSPEEVEEFQKEGWINRKTGEILPDAQFRDKQRARDPGPEIAQHLRSAIAGFAMRPEDIKGTTALLNRADDWTSVDTSNLYGLRDSLGDLERNFAGTPDAAAAGLARRALDDFVGQADQDGRFTGDPEVVSANNHAIQNWRQFRQRYDDGTLIGQLTGQSWRGDRMQPTMDPQTAQKAILGNLSESGDRLRNLQELRDRLGADSPEWQALRREAMDQVAGKDREGADYAQRIMDWRTKNPKMADLIMGAEGNRALSESRVALADTSGRQGAMDTGQAFMTADPADFVRQTQDLAPRARRDAVVSLRQVLRDAMTDPGKSRGMLEGLATNQTAQANLHALLPPGEAIQAVADAQAILRRERAAHDALGNAQEAEGVEKIATDAARLGGAMGGHPGWRAFSNGLVDVLTGKGTPGMRRRDALSIAKDLTDPDKAEAVLSFIEQRAGESGVRRAIGMLRQGSARYYDSLVALGRIPVSYQAGSDATKRPDAKAPAAGDSTPESPLKDMSDEELMQFLEGSKAAGESAPKRSTTEYVEFQPMAFKPVPITDLRKRVLKRESAGDPNAVSPAGAEGLMQVMPGTQRDPGFGVAPMRDRSPSENVRVGNDYLDAMIKEFGSQSLALMAYNWGPENTRRWIARGMSGKVPRETRDYVMNIMGR